MAFNKDTAFQAAQKAALARKVKAAEQHQTTLKQEVQAARRDQENLKRSDTVRYYITTPLAQADEAAKGSAVKLEIQIPAGPTEHKDENDKVIYREMGQLILLEGEGVTTNELWAEWIMREFPEWEVSEVRPQGLSTYAQEIAEAKAELQLQGV